MLALLFGSFRWSAHAWSSPDFQSLYAFHNKRHQIVWNLSVPKISRRNISHLIGHKSFSCLVIINISIKFSQFKVKFIFPLCKEEIVTLVCANIASVHKYLLCCFSSITYKVDIRMCEYRPLALSRLPHLCLTL